MGTERLFNPAVRVSTPGVLLLPSNRCVADHDNSLVRWVPSCHPDAHDQELVIGLVRFAPDPVGYPELDPASAMVVPGGRRNKRAEKLWAGRTRPARTGNTAEAVRGS